MATIELMSDSAAASRDTEQPLERQGLAPLHGSAERLVKSRQRVSDHGEVFTPSWLVEDMLDLVKDESEQSMPASLNRPGFDGGSGYWFPTPVGAVCWAA